MKRIFFIGILAMLVCSCGAGAPRTGGDLDLNKNRQGDSAAARVMDLDANCLSQTIATLKSVYPQDQWPRIELGVRQVAKRWSIEDGNCETFVDFATSNFISDPKELERAFLRFQENVEQIWGHLNEVERYVAKPTVLDMGPALPIDRLFADFNLSSHVVDDLFKTKIAFVILLNFQVFSPAEKTSLGDSWSRDQWAKARMADIFSVRVPSDVSSKISVAFTAADDYITNYNIHMHHLLSDGGERLFPQSLKLISHWGLRDELISQYKNSDGLKRQRIIFNVMQRIIDQSIPAAVVDNPNVDWNLNDNSVRPTDVFDFDKELYKNKKTASNNPESNTRYELLLGILSAVKAADPYYVDTPTFIDRKFQREREIPKNEVVAMLEVVLRSSVLKDTAAVIEKRLGRSLEPFDIWYDDFFGNGSRSESELDAIVQKKYPNVKAFQADMPRILGFLGFKQADAKFISSKITVEPARGSGHALGASRREDNAFLRTRVGEKGMVYKGYNIAIHELGHNVEQVLSLNEMDHYMLQGVPNTAFTETFAFAFQEKDLDILGISSKAGKDKDAMKALKELWDTYEISGVAMVDIRVWDWMYAHPSAGASELKQAFIDISKEVWNEYFAQVFGIRDQTILSIYSHIINSGLYTPDYAIGMIIRNQLNNHFAKNGLAKEMTRMCKIGSVTPNAWMKQAIGEKISAEAMVKNAEKAIADLKAKK